MRKYNDVDSLAAVSTLILAVQRSLRYLQSTDLEEFTRNTMLQDAVFYQLLLISDKIREVDRFFLDRYDYPWYQLTTFRKLMFNEKFDIRVEAVWQMIEKDFPNLEKTLVMMKTKEFPHGSV